MQHANTLWEAPQITFIDSIASCDCENHSLTLTNQLWTTVWASVCSLQSLSQSVLVVRVIHWHWSQMTVMWSKVLCMKWGQKATQDWACFTFSRLSGIGYGTWSIASWGRTTNHLCSCFSIWYVPWMSMMSAMCMHRRLMAVYGQMLAVETEHGFVLEMSALVVYNGPQKQITTASPQYDSTRSESTIRLYKDIVLRIFTFVHFTCTNASPSW